MKTLLLVPSERELHFLAGQPDPEPMAGFPVCRRSEGVWALCGIGPAASALGSAHLIRQYQPDRVILVGIAGAFHQSGWAPGDLLQASTDCFADLGYRENDRFVNLDAMGLAMLPSVDTPLGCRYTLPLLANDLPTANFITVSNITNDLATSDALFSSFEAGLENMEGAAVAMACAFAGVAFHQVRAVSNIVGPRNPAAWQVEGPLRRLGNWLRSRCQ